MNTFKQHLAEGINNTKMYFLNNVLWVAYANNSGYTAANYKPTQFMSDDRSDTAHYDGIIDDIKKFAKNTKPLKANGNSKLYVIPIYQNPYNKHWDDKLDIWGGNIKPEKKVYHMVITEEKNTIVNFFTKKGEALAWLKNK